jgi:geranylgeranyl diphosphate synthase type II
VTETTEKLGKTAAKDETSQKLTYPSVFGLERTQEILAQIYERATALLAAVDRDTARLRAITDFIIHRRS